MNKGMIAAIVIELVGIGATGVGIGIELVSSVDFGLVVTTSGICLIAMGGVIWGKFICINRKKD
ncbi:hypothetical protein Dform_00288 [Dehalogenimonas formicexedens]|uniref:Uncharacterized protein n=1 Tax=Dehalogenimonas formicexedens TaxID=1839801 RepID=A0A1P8F5E4_9CHLR|nr:hypothetical protein [Dehalogenimonas formicexedens]APV43648.1 hypothetical protein Dform_00288 [Dehalogenimonas formicexedens]